MVLNYESFGAVPRKFTYNPAAEVRITNPHQRRVIRALVDKTRNMN
ncbi:hypothetical protein [uncultured Draconibacterium sp.]|nr:hypothetical protein [uncultured Draconibacterium sp.]